MPPDLDESMVLAYNDCCVKIVGAIIIEHYMYVYVCLLITLTRSPKAELRRVQLNGIGRMHMKGASGCRQTVMNDPGAQQLSQMFMTYN